MSHAAAIFFLEKAARRLDASDEDMAVQAAAVRESIEALRMLDYIEQKANEIRSKK